MTNKIQLCRIIYCSLAALHVSSDIFAHHQEHLNCIYSFLYYSRMSWPAGVMYQLEHSFGRTYCLHLHGRRVLKLVPWRWGMFLEILTNSYQTARHQIPKYCIMFTVNTTGRVLGHNARYQDCFFPQCCCYIHPTPTRCFARRCPNRFPHRSYKLVCFLHRTDHNWTTYVLIGDCVSHIPLISASFSLR